MVCFTIRSNSKVPPEELPSDYEQRLNAVQGSTPRQPHGLTAKGEAVRIDLPRKDTQTSIHEAVGNRVGKKIPDKRKEG
jgi:hypothetical protein